MRTITYTITQADAGLTVERYLKGRHGMSTRVLKTLKHHPLGLLLNGVHTRTVDRLAQGDILSVNLIDAPQDYLLSQRMVEILYEDEDVMVFNKPPDMPCHQAKYHQENTLANVFAAHCGRAGLSLAFRCLNRLDKDTTGAVVVAKNAHAATRLWGGVKKVYTALLRGTLPYGCGVVEAPIGRFGEDYINRVVCPEGQYAATGFTVRGYGKDYTWIDAYLYTGRTHQIRVHMGWLGYPLAGDDLYGWDSLLPRQALHCRQVSFPHPVTGEPVVVEAPLPPDFTQALAAVKMQPLGEKENKHAEIKNIFAEASCNEEPESV